MYINIIFSMHPISIAITISIIITFKRKCKIILSFSIANFSALMIGNTSVIITLIMTGLIFSYNIKLKNISVIGIISISAIRFLNVLLGFSIVDIGFDLMQYAVPVGLFVAGISILAKNELSGNPRDQILNKILLQEY